MAKLKPPKLGDNIIHHCNYHGERRGKVIQLLSAQFIYETKEDKRYYCLFREDWKHESKE